MAKAPLMVYENSPYSDQNAGMHRVGIKNKNRFLTYEYYRERLTLSYLKRLSIYLMDQIEYLPRHLRREFVLKMRGKASGIYIVCNIARWKREIIAQLLWQETARSVYFVPLGVEKFKVEKLLQGRDDPVFVIWGMPDTPVLSDLAADRDIPVWRIEDGFIRSAGLGANHTLPESLMLDKSGGIYFNSEIPSDLESFLKTHDFLDQERELARRCMDIVLANKITKYNLNEIGGHYQVSSDRKNIMVFGQCEDDASIIFGSPSFKLNSELIEKAIEENPDADIYFRPHPDVTAGLRKALSNVYDYADQVWIMDKPYPVWENIERFDRIYVITSLAGFEGAMRGCDVRVFGQPFYAGWGITDDFLSCERRERKLTLEEVFFGAYLQAPSYIVPGTGKPSSIEEAIKRLRSG
ncbi:MAG: capsular polysaccharide biosynthesis protein [bacterium]|nr:capsular polysaccharide biosynthesis protein [bacterium]